MAELDQILNREEARWRQEPYEKLRNLLSHVYRYQVQQDGKNYRMEVNAKSKRRDEIVVTIKCYKDSFLGSFWGQARYFAVSEGNKVREIEHRKDL